MANAYVPATLKSGGPDFAVVQQVDIQGGAHPVSAIANWAAEIESRYRAAGMTISDRATGALWMLGADLVSITPLRSPTQADQVDLDAANDRIDVIYFAEMERAEGGGLNLTLPTSAWFSIVTEDFYGFPVRTRALKLQRPA